MVRQFILRDLLVNTFSASILVPGRLRWLVLRLYGVRIERAAVRPRCFFGGDGVRIGAGSYVNTGVFFDGTDEISVGSKVHLGMQAMILTGGHDLGPKSCRAGAITRSAVTIGDGAWIGARAVLMPGVVVEEGVVIAAGAVVTGHCAAGGIYGGVPARFLRALD